MLDSKARNISPTNRITLMTTCLNSYQIISWIDIDYLKTLDTNDGQSSGEDCQRQVAAILKETLKRSGDLAAHWDYGRFACILSDTDSTGTLEMAEKIRKKVYYM